MTEIIDPLLFDTDKYKQRAGAEILTGILRGGLPFAALLARRCIPEKYRVEALDCTILEEVMVVDSCQA
jgi:hypothetical protein